MKEWKKISYADAAYIRNYKNKHPFEKYGCYWQIAIENNIEGHIECWVKWWVYGLLFLPMCIFYFFYCLWDGGLKEFEVPAHNIISNCVVARRANDGDETMFGRLKIIYNRKEK